MEQIATQLGVTQQMISKYLADLQLGCKSKPAKTASNPKGAPTKRQPYRLSTRATLDAKPPFTPALVREMLAAALLAKSS
jgi:hypothetical protein